MASTSQPTLAPSRGEPTGPQWDFAAELARRAEESRRVALWRSSGVMPRHAAVVNAGMSIEAWPEDQRPAVRRAAEVVRRGGLLALLGPWGTGKTQLAAWLVYATCRFVGRAAQYRVFADLLAEIRHQAYVAESSEFSIMARLGNLGLLVVDEYHERRWTEDESLWLGRVLDRRYGNQVPTVLISNQTEADFQATLSPRLVDRMREGGALVEMAGESRRGTEPAVKETA